jgi:ribonucleoside-diphosphate reductase alpha chain
MKKKQRTLEELKACGEAPEFLTDTGYETLNKGYLLPDETPKGMWLRAATSSAKYLKKPELAPKFFDLMWKNWLCLASPVCANMGVERGLPISCFSSYVPDSVVGILDTAREVGLLSKHGGGTSAYFGGIRPRGENINGNGKSDGVIPFNKIFDSVVLGISQGGVRRGAFASYLDIEHGDIDEFLEMRKPSGDINRQCLNIHHGVCISDVWMEKVIAGPGKERDRWKKVIKTRFETGEPYLFFKDNVNSQNPECYKANNLSVKNSNLCTEIYLHTDEEHTFVCCLSSMNLARWEEWKDTDAVQLSIWFLDGVMEEFIQKTKTLAGFERANRFAVKSRALGLGVLGFHTLLQQKMYAFDSLPTYLLNKIIFKRIREQADIATAQLAAEYGEPEWCKGFGRRNSHCLSLAPTVSNSLISGNVSAGIEPIPANAFAQKSAKGTFLFKNPLLEKTLIEHGKNTDDIWKSIVVNEGSVQHLDFLTGDEKKVFETAREMNQFAIVKLAADRQPNLDQGQSVNTFFPSNADPEYVNQVHQMAWRLKLKGLYYLRTTSVLKGDAGSREYTQQSTTYARSAEECTACEG